MNAANYLMGMPAKVQSEYELLHSQFRTVTKYLSMLNRSSAIATIRDSSGSEMSKALAALAQLAAGNHDVAAMAVDISKTPPPDQELRIISCVDELPVDQSFICRLKDFVDKLWAIVTTKNPQQDEKVARPDIIQVTKPQDLNGREVGDYLNALIEEKW